MKESYGFSALFEAMAVQERRDKSDNTIMDVACGAMEASLIGDDVVGSLGVADGDALCPCNALHLVDKPVCGVDADKIYIHPACIQEVDVLIIQV